MLAIDEVSPEIVKLLDRAHGPLPNVDKFFSCGRLGEEGPKGSAR